MRAVKLVCLCMVEVMSNRLLSLCSSLRNLIARFCRVVIWVVLTFVGFFLMMSIPPSMTVAFN